MNLVYETSPLIRRVVALDLGVQKGRGLNHAFEFDSPFVFTNMVIARLAILAFGLLCLTAQAYADLDTCNNQGVAVTKVGFFFLSIGLMSFHPSKIRVTVTPDQ